MQMSIEFEQYFLSDTRVIISLCTKRYSINYLSICQRNTCSLQYAFTVSYWELQQTAMGRYLYIRSDGFHRRCENNNATMPPGRIVIQTPTSRSKRHGNVIVLQFTVQMYRKMLNGKCYLLKVFDFPFVSKILFVY